MLSFVKALAFQLEKGSAAVLWLFHMHAIHKHHVRSTDCVINAHSDTHSASTQLIRAICAHPSTVVWPYLIGIRVEANQTIRSCWHSCERFSSYHHTVMNDYSATCSSCVMRCETFPAHPEQTYYYKHKLVVKLFPYHYHIRQSLLVQSTCEQRVYISKWYARSRVETIEWAKRTRNECETQSIRRTLVPQRCLPQWCKNQVNKLTAGHTGDHTHSGWSAFRSWCGFLERPNQHYDWPQRQLCVKPAHGYGRRRSAKPGHNSRR